MRTPRRCSSGGSASRIADVAGSSEPRPETEVVAPQQIGALDALKAAGEIEPGKILAVGDEALMREHGRAMGHRARSLGEASVTGQYRGSAVRSKTSAIAICDDFSEIARTRKLPVLRA